MKKDGVVSEVGAQKAGFKSISDISESIAKGESERTRSRSEAFKNQTEFNRAAMDAAESPEERAAFVQMQQKNYEGLQEATDADAERSHDTFRGALTIAGKALQFVVGAVAVGVGAVWARDRFIK